MTFPENFIFPGFPGFPDPVGTLNFTFKTSKSTYESHAYAFG